MYLSSTTVPTYYPKPASACRALGIPSTLHAPAARSPWISTPTHMTRRCTAPQRSTHTTAALPVVDMLPATAVLADLDPSTAGTLAFILRPLFTIATLLFIVRIVLTWFPEQVWGHRGTQGLHMCSAVRHLIPSTLHSCCGAHTPPPLTHDSSFMLWCTPLLAPLLPHPSSHTPPPAPLFPHPSSPTPPPNITGRQGVSMVTELHTYRTTAGSNTQSGATIGGSGCVPHRVGSPVVVFQ